MDSLKTGLVKSRTARRDSPGGCKAASVEKFYSGSLRIVRQRGNSRGLANVGSHTNALGGKQISIVTIDW